MASPILDFPVDDSTETSEEVTHDNVENFTASPVLERLAAELRYQEKLLVYEHREEGPISISGRSKNNSSVNVLLESAIMVELLPKLNEEFKKRFSDIIEIHETKRSQVYNNPACNVYSELHYDVTFKVNGDSHKVKMKIYTSTCRVQIQSCGPRVKFIEKMLMGHAEYFATKFVDVFACEILQSRENLNDEVLSNIKEKIKQLKESMLKEQGVENMPTKAVVDRRCYAKCNRNVNIKNKEAYGRCKKCDRVEHFLCSGTSQFEKKLVLAGKMDFHCARCISNDPSLLENDTHSFGPVTNNELNNDAPLPDLNQIQWELEQRNSTISRLQELLKQGSEKYNSLMTATNTELSDHRASYRAFANENEKLREERDTLLKIYNVILKEEVMKKNGDKGKIINEKSTAEILRVAEGRRSNLPMDRTSNNSNNNNSNNNNSNNSTNNNSINPRWPKMQGDRRRRRPPFCHYFNNDKPCPYEGRCKYIHEDSTPCRVGEDCQRYLCQFKHPSLSAKDSFLSSENAHWNGGGPDTTTFQTQKRMQSHPLPMRNHSLVDNSNNYPVVLDNMSGNSQPEPVYNNPQSMSASASLNPINFQQRPQYQQPMQKGIPLPPLTPFPPFPPPQNQLQYYIMSHPQKQLHQQC